MSLDHQIQYENESELQDDIDGNRESSGERKINRKTESAGKIIFIFFIFIFYYNLFFLDIDYKSLQGIFIFYLFSEFKFICNNNIYISFVACINF